MRGLTSARAAGASRARRGRTLLIVVGIALGVGVLFASLATDAGIDAAIDRTVRDIVGRADLRVAAFGEDGPVARERRPRSTRRPGVAVAAPALERRTYLVPDARRPTARRRRSRSSASTRPPRRSPRPAARRGRAPRRARSVRRARHRARSPPRTGSPSARASRSRAAPAARSSSRVVGILAGDGPFVGSGGRTVVVPLRTAQRLLRRPTASAGSTSIVGEGASRGRGRGGARGRADDRAVRPLVAARRGRVAPRLDRRLPGDDRADRRDRAVRRRVPHLQHALDDRRRAGPRARPAAGRRRDPRPARAVRPRPGGSSSASSARVLGLARRRRSSPSLMAGRPPDRRARSRSTAAAPRAAARSRSPSRSGSASRSPPRSSRPAGRARSRRSRRSRPGSTRPPRGARGCAGSSASSSPSASPGCSPGRGPRSARARSARSPSTACCSSPCCSSPFLLGALGRVAGLPFRGSSGSRSGSPAPRSPATAAGRR